MEVGEQSRQRTRFLSRANQLRLECSSSDEVGLAGEFHRGNPSMWSIYGPALGGGEAATTGRCECGIRTGKPYPLSDASWWETGLLVPANWQAKWIGYEEEELHSLREAGATWITNAAVPNYSTKGDTTHGFLLAFPLQKTVESGQFCGRIRRERTRRLSGLMGPGCCRPSLSLCGNRCHGRAMSLRT